MITEANRYTSEAGCKVLSLKSVVIYWDCTNGNDIVMSEDMTILISLLISIQSLCLAFWSVTLYSPSKPSEIFMYLCLVIKDEFSFFKEFNCTSFTVLILFVVLALPFNTNLNLFKSAHPQIVSYSKQLCNCK